MNRLYILTNRYYKDDIQSHYIDVFKNKFDAIQAMELIVDNALIQKNGITPINDNIINLDREHSDDSSIWDSVKMDTYFVTRSNKEFDKLVVREKYSIGGYIYNSWSTRKIFSVEISSYCPPTVYLDFIGHDYVSEFCEFDGFEKCLSKIRSIGRVDERLIPNGIPDELTQDSH